jgi:BirA family biotin operon repressor/biotin-[acetyl-CoA-carboxylase] ligase
MSDALPTEIATGLEHTASRRGALGCPVYYFTETGSTNDVAARLAEQGASEGTLVLASAQTAGRGRLGRQWYSPPDAGLYASLIFRDASTAPFLTLAGGLATAEGVHRATGLPVQIKWPNDVIVVDASRPTRRRKLAGILAEGSSGTDGVTHVVLGVGINLRSTAYPPELADRATSIERELGRPVETGRVLGEVLACLNERLTPIRSGSSIELIEAWRRLSPTSAGGAVEFDTPEGRAEGIAAGIDATGALLVRVGGRVERIIAGEVVWK